MKYAGFTGLIDGGFTATSKRTRETLSEKLIIQGQLIHLEIGLHGT